jgi:hypothetical protein
LVSVHLGSRFRFSDKCAKFGASHIFTTFGVYDIQGWEQRADEKNVTGAGHEWWYHWKAEELKRACPGALVPTLIPIDEETGKPDESKVINS